MEKHNDNRGMSFAGTLCMIFVVLRLTNNIDWNWIWVLSPIWISLLLVLVFAVIDAVDEIRQKNNFADKNQ